MKKKPKYDQVTEAKRSARAIIGEPSRNRNRGPHRVKSKYGSTTDMYLDVFDELEDMKEEE